MHEQYRGNDYEINRRIFELTGSISSAPINPQHRLVQDRHHPVVEFFSEQLGGRFIALEKGGVDEQQHLELIENRLPVFSGIYSENGLLLLNVPRGARLIKNYMNGIIRDPYAYSTIFHEIGQTLNDLESAGLPMPDADERPLLQQFAFVVDGATIEGGKLFMTPPYAIHSGGGPDQTKLALQSELVLTRAFRPDHIQFLMEQVDEGWRNPF